MHESKEALTLNKNMLTSKKVKKSIKEEKYKLNLNDGINEKIVKRRNRAKLRKGFKKSSPKDPPKKTLEKAGDLTSKSTKEIKRIAEESKTRKLHKTFKKLKRDEDKLNMMFKSTVDPYQRPLCWWEKPFVKYAFSCPSVKSKLELLMGSNVVRLTDRKYMLKLISRIRQDHESQQEARIQERKMRELMRTKKMILNRLIPVQEAPAEIRQYPLFQLYLYCDAIIERHRKKRVSKKVKISKSLYRLLYPEKLEEVVEATEEEEIPTKEVIVDGVPELIPLTPEEIEEAAKEKDLQSDIENGYMFSREEYENLHYEADAVKKLKETRSVDEMYARAHEIVGILFSLAGDERRKRCARDKEITEQLKSIVTKTDTSSISKAQE